MPTSPHEAVATHRLQLTSVKNLVAKADYSVSSECKASFDFILMIPVAGPVMDTPAPHGAAGNEKQCMD